ncbi:hypothetical protein [Adlercreutzia murintestinalis]|uniref:hypothetical protein n=1 Tax=Adlercreutzia murintestinalis TaxID=2941325 RepID=UPI00203D0C12|nr:hypothetical protein [Adlercreutzia murintestinalis]
MCFRPADASAGPMKCPECGKPIQMLGGMKIEKCPFCKADFSEYINGTKPVPGAPGAPAAPGAPGAPAAPGAPKPPSA